jgi:hypothetical protein
MPAKPLPPRPSLEQYKKQAKDLVKAYRSDDADVRRRVHEQLPGVTETRFALADAQFTIAREHGFESWPRFAKRIKESGGRLSSAPVWKAAEKAIVAGDVVRLEALLRDDRDVFSNERPQSWWNNTLTPDYGAGDARAIIASTHKFDTWDHFLAHQASMKDPTSDIARFESAVDMVIGGDMVSLTRALNDHPGLISGRSKRQHHSMLLHYVGANGVEGFRQHTPANAVAVTELLLDRGADVNAMADMYGGSTTLGLAATSLHPKRAGVQEPLIQLLLDRGATFDALSGQRRSLVGSCLENGRPEAAEYLATRGAPLDLRSAAGVGRLDVVRSCLSNDAAKPSAIEMESALLAAATHGRTAVAQYLVDQGISVDAEADGFTAANASATSGHLDTLRMFIERGASLEKKNRYGGTSLGGALWGLLNRPPETPAEVYVSIIELLVTSGAIVPRSFVEWWKEVDEVPADVHAAVLTMLAAHASES